jgi:hypothetical protein
VSACIVIGGGPAGLAAAEVLTRGRVPRRPLRRHAELRPQVPAGRARRAEPDPRRALRALRHALPPAAAAAAGGARRLHAAGSARLVRGPRRGHLRRQFEPGLSNRPEGRPLAARLAAPPARAGCAPAHPAPLAGLERGRRAASSPRRPARSRWRPPPPCWRWAGRAGRGWAATAPGCRCCAARGAEVAPLQPSNCGFDVLGGWSANCCASASPASRSSRWPCSLNGRRQQGEFVLTATGIEGSLVYAFSRALREAIARDGCATLHLDLLPQTDHRAGAGPAGAGPGQQEPVELSAKPVPASGR